MGASLNSRPRLDYINSMLSGADLRFLVDTLMPGTADKAKMVRALREDEEILEGVLKDGRLVERILEDPEAILRISPRLFFLALLNRVRQDLEHRSYTLEQEHRYQTVIFDAGEVAGLLGEKPIRDYLAEMLASFARVNSFSVTVRMRRGMWRRLRFNDFDLDSLIRFSQLLQEQQRFQLYRRSADLCLFTLGVFPERLSSPASPPGSGSPRPGKQASRGREGCAEQGRFFYRAAARQKEAQLARLDGVLEQLAEHFLLASKPLSFLADHYLKPFKRDLFPGEPAPGAPPAP